MNTVSELPEVSRLDALLRLQRAAFAKDMCPSAAVRRERLARLQALVENNEQAIVAAIGQDFGNRSTHESMLAEIFMTLSAIRHNASKLKGWMRTRHVGTPLHMLPGSSRLMRQPLGVVGVIAPWNYPCQLSLVPAAAAIAAGNRVLIKPSELTPAFSALLAQLVAEAFEPAELAVVQGGVDIGQAFAALPFDHLFFTGSTSVGRIVAAAAARNLTPVTLELGGKSPALVDVSADIAVAAQRIAYGKLVNAGQTCVAPDYVLVPRGKEDDFIRHFTAAVDCMYPAIAANPDYTSIISQRHYDRLQRLVRTAEADGARVITLDPGAEGSQPAMRKMLPTLLTRVNDDMDVMREEIFGPILPILSYDSSNEALAYINRHDHPLALYWFGSDSTERERVLASTLSGGVTVNDVLWHVAQENMPFGGVGASGSGSYHGEAGFLTFSKQKPVFRQAHLNAFGLFRPPYGKLFESLLGFLKKWA
jgi:coniferyl-aldehyde dehydrogenase